jgi:hypothetical protein
MKSYEFTVRADVIGYVNATNFTEAIEIFKDRLNKTSNDTDIDCSGYDGEDIELTDEEEL